jgi:diacylglycerol kinase (ATP)
MNKTLALATRLTSMKHAIHGLTLLLTTQPNARLHAIAAIFVTLIGLYFGFTKAEWCWIILTITAVWTAEAFNTALEFLADAVSPDYHPLIGKAKDVAAGAVLIAAIGSVLIGLIIIVPYLFKSN